MQARSTQTGLATFSLVLAVLCAPGARAASSSAAADNAEPSSGEYRLTLFPYHKISDTLTGFGYLGHAPIPTSTTRPITSAGA
jgi:hypothetical protein